MTREEEMIKVVDSFLDDPVSKKLLNRQALYAFAPYLLKWADEHPSEEHGKELLYVLNKGVKQGKKEMLDKTCEWLENRLAPDGSIAPTYASLIHDFKKAMEEQI